MASSFTVIGDGRKISFVGDLLARASSRRPGKWRWIELRLYRTEDTGTYIVEKIGASRVMHVPECSEVIENLPRFQEVYTGEDPEDPQFQYHDCVPQYYDFTALLVEKDRCWAKVTPRPDAVIKCLMQYRDGSRWLPKTSVQLLTMAAEVDEGIREAYLLADSIIV